MYHVLNIELVIGYKLFWRFLCQCIIAFWSNLILDLRSNFIQSLFFYFASCFALSHKLGTSFALFFGLLFTSMLLKCLICAYLLCKYNPQEGRELFAKFLGRSSSHWIYSLSIILMTSFKFKSFGSINVQTLLSKWPVLFWLTEHVY